MTARFPPIAAALLVAASVWTTPAAGQAGPPAADAKFARVALFHSPANGIVRSKNVAKVNRVSTGRYCVKTKVKITDSVPDVSVEVRKSTGTGLVAYWRWNAFDCPNLDRWIEVYTLKFSGTETLALSDDVAFTLTVP